LITNDLQKLSYKPTHPPAESSLSLKQFNDSTSVPARSAMRLSHMFAIWQETLLADHFVHFPANSFEIKGAKD
jgi:hypothetical protein